MNYFHFLALVARQREAEAALDFLCLPCYSLVQREIKNPNFTVSRENCSILQFFGLGQSCMVHMYSGGQYNAMIYYIVKVFPSETTPLTIAFAIL